ncbi:sugar phosphate isomerase/epimerase family protein [Paenibacillus psychroresistens]|nr:sugar phosphate isomerase/epimerase family protein [Paenibacillus psychroresistens]
MRLSFSTLPCEGWSVEQLIACCQTYGFTGIELKLDEQYAVSLATSAEDLRIIAKQFQSVGITITNLGTRVIFNGIREEESEVLQELKMCILMAEMLGAKGVRIFLGTYLRYKNAPEQPKDSNRIIHYLQDACDYAAAHQAEVWIETHNEFSTGQVLRELLDRINRPNCKVVYDIIHPYEFGESPQETIRMLGHACAHVHMKDGVPFEDPLIHEWKYTLTGDGQLPLEDIIAELKKNDYEGYYSLEWEPKWRPELRELSVGMDTVFAEYIQLMERINKTIMR